MMINTMDYLDDVEKKYHSIFIDLLGEFNQSNRRDTKESFFDSDVLDFIKADAINEYNYREGL